MPSTVEGVEVGAESVVGLAGDVAFEAAEDLASVEAVCGAFSGVGARAARVLTLGELRRSVLMRHSSLGLGGVVFPCGRAVTP